MVPAMNNDEKPLCPICRDCRLETARYSTKIEIDGEMQEVPELECWLCLDCGATTILQDQQVRNSKRIDAAHARHGKN